MKETGISVTQAAETVPDVTVPGEFEVAEASDVRGAPRERAEGAELAEWEDEARESR